MNVVPVMTQVSSLSLFSPAKINLFLHITGKRSDGYHNLQTVFRLLDWGDQLHFTVSNQTYSTDNFETDTLNKYQVPDDTNLPIRLTSNVPVTAHLTDNLITQAALALVSYLKQHSLAKQLPIIDIHLHKTLPSGAGLGGGSSNAATTLLALNQLWHTNLDTQTLIDIGATVGADVPIFIFGEDAIAEGIGEVLTSISLPEQHYLLLNPNAHASTQALFAHPDLRRDMRALSHTTLIENKDDYLNTLTLPYTNVFEPVVTQMVNEVDDALNYLKSLERITQTTPRMTGSGSSVFLPIPTQNLDAIADYVEQVQPPCQYVFTKSLGDNTTN